MKTNHTPGPWILNYPPIGKEDVFVIGDSTLNGDVISPFVKIIVDEYNLSESEANAKLIAAAPELLKSLVDLLEWSNGIIEMIDSNEVSFKTLNDAKQAIEKATK